ncbi:MAG: DUF4258 domain-containing protein [Oligoflexia bacterium]|nr:DUF4258 domain-containing protein [Oligoflexia bacterium]
MPKKKIVKKIIIKRWVLSPHAARRMQERKITVDDIDTLINYPDLVLEQGPKYILAKNFKNRSDNMLASVILEKEDNDLWYIITVMVNFQKK